MLKIIVTAALLVISFKSSSGARILGVAPVPSFSHQNSFRPLWRELSLRGHQVTLVTTDPVNDASLTNLTEIDLHDLAYDIWNSKMKGIFEKKPSNMFSLMWFFFPMSVDLIDQELGDPKVQALIKNKTEHFDLVMLEYFFMPTLYAFAERFNCPFITICSYDGFAQIYEQIGNPSHPVINPDRFISFNNKLSFYERLLSVSLRLFIDALIYLHKNAVEDSVTRHFGLENVDMFKLAENTSMVFLNSDQIFFRVRPLSPNVIQFGGGTHLNPKQQLPTKLQNYLDSASDGFIYFSLGSNIKSKDLPQETLKTLIETFSELPFKVLWKFELEELDNLPANVMISKWLPQQDVLRHPNIKLFITQGGLQSIEESLHSYVPIVCLPFWADQHANVKQAVDNGLGLSSNSFALNKKEFKTIILEVINNPKYRERVKQFSNLIQDQPMTGLERAIWWTEYVIRHKGASHFKSPALGIPFYQYYLLDVIGFYCAVLFATIYIIVVIFKLICKACKFVIKSKSKLKSQ